MTDNLNRPTKHGLGRPPNDGAPRPNPPRGAKISRACNAARKQGELDGLRKAARLICGYCGAWATDWEEVVRQPVPNPDSMEGYWWHDPAPSIAPCGGDDCLAGSIHAEIAAMPKHGDPPAQPAKAKSQAQRMVTVCDNCLQASCWQGIFYCEKYKQAGITQKSVAELHALGLEDPSYWEGADDGE